MPTAVNDKSTISHSENINEKNFSTHQLFVRAQSKLEPATPLTCFSRWSFINCTASIPMKFLELKSVISSRDCDHVVAEVMTRVASYEFESIPLNVLCIIAD